MPSVNYKLHSEKLNTGGGASMLSPTLLSGSVVSGLRAPTVNINAGNVRHADRRVPGIVADNTFEEAGKFANVLIQETLKYQDRRDAVTANDIVTRYENDLREQWAGSVDSEGKFKAGYSSLTGNDANDAYSGTMKVADATMEKYLKAVSPGVREKALLRMHNTRSTFSSRAATHNAQQLKFAEKEAFTAKTQSIHKEMEVDAERGWGALKNHALTAGTLEEGISMLTEGMNLATNKIYDEMVVGGAPEEVALKAATDFFEAHREELPEDTEVNISSKLRQQWEAVQARKDAKIKKANAAYGARLEAFGSTEVGGMLLGGTESMKGLALYSEEVFKAFPGDPAKAKKVLLGNYQEAFRGIMQARGYTEAMVVWGNLQKTIVEENLAVGDVGLVGDLTKFMTGALKNESKTLELEAANSKKKEFMVGMMQAEDVATIAAIANQAANDPDISANDLSFIIGASSSRKSELEGRRTEGVKQTQAVNAFGLRTEARNGATPEFEAKILAAFERGEISSGELEKLQDTAVKTSAGKVRPGYNAVEKDMRLLVKNEGMIYDPVARKTVFKNMQTPEQLETILKNQAYLGKSPETINEIAVSALMDQAEIWAKSPENADKNFEDFTQDFVMQQPETKRNWISRAARFAANVLLPEPWEVSEEPLAPRVEYQDPVVPEATPVELRGVSGIKVIPADPATEAYPVGIVSPKTVEEYAINSIPDSFKSSPIYADKSTNWLLALQMLRENGKMIDQYDHATINRAAEAVQNTPEFYEWKKTKTGSL